MLSYNSGIKGALALKNINNFKFSNHTTYGLGGKAKICYAPQNLYQAKLAINRCVKGGIDYRVVGNGSNILASDSGFDGAVILTTHLKGIIRLSQDKLLCLAGTNVSELLNYCKRKRLGGLEYLFGIPATIGGITYMNAGVGEFCIGNNVEQVIVFDGKIHKFSVQNCNFTYKHSTLCDINAFILAIIIRVEPSTKEKIENSISYFKNRRAHLPKGKSCGCVFKNPQGNFSAGFLIDASELKGKRIGKAYVSPVHANFIINEGDSACDVKRLIDLVKREVYIKTGVMLCEEVAYIGEFNDFNS
ncbi:MAG: UDP-N-acetylmuramate dehydrogenase [Candidatus Coproplasma sp.]